MYLHIINISEYKESDGTYIIDLGGDSHLGSSNASEKHFEEFLRSRYMKFLMGDLTEAIGPFDRRFQHQTHKNPITESFMYLKHLLVTSQEDPNSGPILGMLKGNHEAVVFSKYGNLYSGQYQTESGEIVEGGLCEELGIRYGGFISLFVLTDGVNISKWLLTHGKVAFNYKAGEEERKNPNKKIRTRDSMKHTCVADLYACGHGHQLVTVSPPMKQRLCYDDKKKTLVMRKVPVGDPNYYCMTGSFMKVYEMNVDGNYAEEMLVEPSDIGWVRVHMDSELKIIKMEEVIPDAL